MYLHKDKNLNALKDKNILIAPLDWGLGHTSRCVPIIKSLIGEGVNVTAACEGAIADFLLEEIPNLKIIILKGYKIKYSDKWPMLLIIVLQIPKILFAIIYEHRWLKKIKHQYAIDLIISDNRYGLWNKHIPSVLITHQINIKIPSKIKFVEKILNRINHFFISKYTECWIPDFSGINNLSGNLSHTNKFPLNTHFIGPLSRMKKDGIEDISLTKEFDVLVILSGLEPQRSLLEKKLIKELSNLQYKSLIVAGLPQKKEFHKTISEKIAWVNFLPSFKLKKIIVSSKYIVCRSGYSSIMDLVSLNKKAILIPTPGQTEQEYLADYHFKKGYFYICKQSDLNIEQVLSKIENYQPKISSVQNEYEQYTVRLEYLLKKLTKL